MRYEWDGQGEDLLCIVIIMNLQLCRSRDYSLIEIIDITSITSSMAAPVKQQPSDSLPSDDALAHVRLRVRDLP